MPYSCNGCGHVFEPVTSTVGLFCRECRPPVCSTCDDTHRMELGDRVVLCTACPTPCRLCRQGGRGAFCEETPCRCDCHRKDARIEELAVALGKERSELERLRALINTPRTDEFFEAVRSEAAHQVERWGVEHDAGKRAEDWLALYFYLLGKAAKAHFEGDADKLLHHIITVAAVALNWHRNLTGESTRMRPGVAP